MHKGKKGREGGEKEEEEEEAVGVLKWMRKVCKYIMHDRRKFLSL